MTSSILHWHWINSTTVGSIHLLAKHSGTALAYGAVRTLASSRPVNCNNCETPNAWNNQALEIILVNICILEIHFCHFFQVLTYTQKSHFLHSVNINKCVRIYHLQHKKNIKILFRWGLDFTSRNWLSPMQTEIRLKSHISENTHFYIVHPSIK